MADAITKIAVSGFKSIKQEQSIEVRPLTILAGANSSGKSSIMQPLLLMKQTLEQTFDPGPLWLGGPNVRFDKAEEMLTKGADTFCVKIEAGPENWHRVCFKKAGMSVDVAEVEFQRDGFCSGRLWPGMPENELRLHMANNPVTGDPKGWNWSLALARCSLDPIASSKGEGREEKGRLGSLGGITPQIHRVFHVSALRGNRGRAYFKVGVPKTFPGTFETYTASVLNAWQASGNDEALRRLEKALMKLDLTSKIKAEPLDANNISVFVGRLPARNKNGENDLVNIADVGFGVGQALPVVVGLVAATDKNLVYIEDPEADLHPNAQFALASVLADAAKRGVRVVVETHSSVLLRGVQTLVASGKLAPDLVRLHWFTRDKQGLTRVHSSDLDENGAFGDWPEDFDEIELGAESAYLDAVEARHARP